MRVPTAGGEKSPGRGQSRAGVVRGSRQTHASTGRPRPGAAGLMSWLPLRANARRVSLWASLFFLLMAALEVFPLNGVTLGPAREVDLSSLGQGITPPLPHLLQFVNDSTLAVGLVVYNAGTPKLVRRGEARERSAFFLHTALVDASTGRVLRWAEWPTESLRHSGLVATPGSKLVVLLGDRVALYSDSLELMRRLKLPGPKGSVWLPSASPSGRSVLFVRAGGRKPSTWAWVDADRLRVVHVWSAVPPQPQALPISDDYITFARCHPAGGRLPCRLIVRPLDGNSVQAVAGISLSYGSPEFVADNLLFALGWPHGGISIINLPKHRVLFRGSRGPGQVFGSAVSAPDAARFVVPALDGGPGLDYLYVFDGPSARLRTLRIRGVSSLAWPWWFAVSSSWLALSPDGRLLAVMENFKTVLIFRLPPPEGH